MANSLKSVAYNALLQEWAERSVKPFVISKKNLLFANTAKGEQVGSIPLADTYFTTCSYTQAKCS